MRTALSFIAASGIATCLFLGCFQGARFHASASPPPRGPEQAGSPLPLSPGQLDRLHQALAPLHAQYDPAEKMLRSRFSSPGYHTTLKGGSVHRTRKSLGYAVALLDTGDSEHRRRAIDILHRVISLQDQNPRSRTYGIWPWFLEEPLEKMSPPDWNWADFCGTALLQVRLHHGDRLPADLMARVDQAVRHAARSIERRNVGPGYTNIAIMGTYVTLVAAETYGIRDLREYALARLRRFHEYTFRSGAFTEYNSPTYTVVALKELGRMRKHVRDPEARRLVEDIYRLAWEEIAQHFHPPTRQWAGPHSRCYRTLLGASVLALIQRATSDRVHFGVSFPAPDGHRLPLPCPRDLEDYFRRLDVSRDVVKTFLKGEPPLIGTTHLEPSFALGSINRGDLWNQRRPLLAYWGTAREPSYLRLRLLHDGYDFAAAQFFSAQEGGDVLGGINFATNGGDTHVSLDRIKNATFRARDLRLRFELGGAAARREVIRPADPSEPVHLRFGELHLYLAVPYAAFGEESARWDAGAKEGEAWYDVVLYQGAERPIASSELKAAVIGVAVRLASRESAAPAVDAAVRDGRLAMSWGELSLSLPVRPGRAADLRNAYRASSPALRKVAGGGDAGEL